MTTLESGSSKSKSASTCLPTPRKTGNPLVLPLHQITSHRLQAVGAGAVGRQCGKGLFDEVGGVPLALLDAEDGGPRGLLGRLILAGGLAEVSGVDGHVEHIVDDLKSKPGLASEGVEADHVGGSGSGVDASGDDADPDERARLGTVDGFDELGRGFLMLAFD